MATIRSATSPSVLMIQDQDPTADIAPQNIAVKKKEKDSMDPLKRQRPLISKSKNQFSMLDSIYTLEDCIDEDLLYTLEDCIGEADGEDIEVLREHGSLPERAT